MPRKLERQLREEAREKFPGDEKAQDRYVYGYMNKHGLLRKNRKNKRDRDEHDYDD